MGAEADVPSVVLLASDAGIGKTTLLAVLEGCSGHANLRKGRADEELELRLNQLDDILATAPADCRHLIAELRAGKLTLDDTAEHVRDLLNDQQARRDWIVEHWPQYSDLDECRKFETSTARPAPTVGKLASARIADLMNEATTLGAKRASPSDEHGHSSALLEASDQALVTLMELATGAVVRAVSDFAALYSA